MSLDYVLNNTIPRSPAENLMGSDMHITLFNDLGTWKIKDHTEAVPAFSALTDQTRYDIPPNYQVRWISIEGGDSLHYDKKRQNHTFRGIVQTLIVNTMHAIWPCTIILDSSTTATTIHLHG